MSVLVLCDDKFHPAAIVRDGLAPLAGRFRFDWIENAVKWSPERMAKHPLTLIAKSNHVSREDHRPWMTEAAEAAFVEYVRKGGGLLAVHSGTAGYAETRQFRRLLGGVFVRHPKQCNVAVEPREGCALAEGAAAFAEKDEHYFMELDDAGADVFLTTRSEHGEQPGGWTRAEGRGRVCVLTPGHNREVWLHPSFQTLLANALNWRPNP